MIFRNLMPNGDWTFGKGVNNYLSGDAAIGLNIETRLLSWLNDCFFDTKAGVDWLNRLGQKNQANILALDCRRIILTSPGVTGLLNFDIVQNGREFTVTYNITTVNSQSYQNSINLGASPQ
jgi:hypothetical protein